MLTSGFDVGGFWHYEAVNLLSNGQPYASEASEENENKYIESRLESIYRRCTRSLRTNTAYVFEDIKEQNENVPKRSRSPITIGLDSSLQP
ncbi:hypothetical protein BofuT4_uP078880.1 [Botrytis cinerea T4]|uniref:Uncharacterized protein n=1 Tax=Botryotinia fuckeliana (strain T4) TaxID=999810 RepID=G2YL75_BOTF4|nr:hypothetical protein BofuT4_uP078880.1 [Botrytis cinerea T4]